MVKQKNKSLVRRFYASRLFLLISLLFFGLVGLGYVRAYYQDYKIKQEINTLEQEIRKLETKKIESLEILQYVISPDFVEEKARLELNMKKPGENVAIIQRGEELSEAVVENYKEDSPELSNPKKWLNYFLNKPIDKEI